MDIIEKYRDILNLYCDSCDLLEYMKDNGGITLSTYWILKYSSENDETHVHNSVVDMIINQRNAKGAGHLFQYIVKKHPQLVMMIPELSTGERYSLHLGNGQFLKILNTYNLPFLRFITMQVCE